MVTGGWFIILLWGSFLFLKWGYPNHSFRIFPYKPSIVGYPIYENPELAAVVNLLQFLPDLFWTTNVETCIVNKNGG